MSPRRLSSAFAATLAFAAIAVVPLAAHAGDRDFFDGTAGVWQGPGEIVAGKYKGTKFTCDLKGESKHGGGAGLSLDGACHVGVFKQPMSASFERNGNTYKGKFLDGAEGKGLDIISGNVSGNKVIVGINRKNLNGAMIARLKDKNTLNVTISVRVNDTLVPVIGMTLDRKIDQAAVGSIK
jgi:uncharacterized protein (DUF2147 family)